MWTENFTEAEIDFAPLATLGTQNPFSASAKFSVPDFHAENNNSMPPVTECMKHEMKGCSVAGVAKSIGRPIKIEMSLFSKLNVVTCLFPNHL